MPKTSLEIVEWVADLGDDEITGKDQVSLSFLFALRYAARRTREAYMAGPVWRLEKELPKKKRKVRKLK